MSLLGTCARPEAPCLLVPSPSCAVIPKHTPACIPHDCVLLTGKVSPLSGADPSTKETPAEHRASEGSLSVSPSLGQSIWCVCGLSAHLPGYCTVHTCSRDGDGTPLLGVLLSGQTRHPLFSSLTMSPWYADSQVAL